VASTDRLQLNDLPFQRLGANHNAASGGVEARLTKTLDLAVRYENGWVKFERFEPNDPRTGGIVHGARADLTHRFSERLSFGGTYNLRRSNMNQGTRQQMFYEAGGLLRYVVAHGTSLEVAAGLSHLNDINRDFSQNGSFVEGSLTHRAERATFGAEYDRDYKPSFGFGGPTQNDEVSGYIRMPLSRNRLYVQESASGCGRARSIPSTCSTSSGARPGSTPRWATHSSAGCGSRATGRSRARTRAARAARSTATSLARRSLSLNR
jgi:hypothetical protein